MAETEYLTNKRLAKKFALMAQIKGYEKSTLRNVLEGLRNMEINFHQYYETHGDSLRGLKIPGAGSVSLRILEGILKYGDVYPHILEEAKIITEQFKSRGPTLVSLPDRRYLSDEPSKNPEEEIDKDFLLLQEAQK